jgi:hypothetical protein
MTRTLLLITPGFVARGDFDARGRLVALGKAVPPAPTVRLVQDSLSNDDVLLITPGAAARWITVRVLRDGAWTTQVLPAQFRRITIGSAASAPAERIVVTVVNRNGLESAARELRATNARRRSGGTP